jgi:hypothetical protein
MMLMPSLIIAAALWPAKSESNAEWAVIPADSSSRSITSFELPNSPNEEIVRLIGAVLVTAEPAGEPHEVVGFGIPSAPEEGKATTTSRESSAFTIPADAYWPDAEGRIAANFAKRDSRSRAAGIRNPWEVRIAPKSTSLDSVFRCNGIIVGGEGGSVAILNGRLVRRGDSLGDFNVAGVLTNGVILERSGLYFVVPMGRRTIVTTSGG